MVNRHKRERDIWEIADSLREKISKIKYIKSVEVSPYGSTAIASIRANIDAKLSSSSIDELQSAGENGQDGSF